MSKTVVRIATRQSKLALWQANFIRSELKRVHRGLVIELVGITTKGDRWLDAPLSDVGGKGLFIKELEAAMLAGHADIAVHSVKDLPAQLPAEFELPVIAYREDVADVLVSNKGDLASLPQGAKIGSSSLRRRAQLMAQRPDLDVQPIRGNVDTRLGKLEAQEFDGIVLAAAGLNRLGLKIDGIYPLSTDLCLPAPGQGALGIECLAGADIAELLKPLKNETVARCVTAERGISLGLGADCSLPVAAHAEMNSAGEIELRARVANVNGTRILHAQHSGIEPTEVAATVVGLLYQQGAEEILASLKTI